MASYTTRRTPFSVPVRATKDGFFNHTQFKGFCDNSNDINLDPQIFADTNNMYVDENGVLISRPPLKFFDGEAYIVNQWFFGSYGLRLYRVQTQLKNDNDEIVKDDYGNPIEFFLFRLRCITHDTFYNDIDMFSEIQWLAPINSVGNDFLPKITCIQKEDKIFIWFTDRKSFTDFVCFNTAGYYMSEYDKTLPFFETAYKYIYLPVHKLVINGIETELESKNFLTDTYRKRYQQSMLSKINFEKLVDRHMSVSLNGPETDNKSKYLYDIIVKQNQEKMLVYPYSPVGINYHIDIVNTPRASVIMRYSDILHSIEISFDGKTFNALPLLENIIGNPLITKDGLWVIAFTTKGLARCRIVAQETLDFIEPERVLTWSIVPYLRFATENGYPLAINAIDESFVPIGYFETVDQFAYIIKAPYAYGEDITLQTLYTEWLSGSNDIIWAHYNMMNDDDSHWNDTSDNMKIHFSYTAPVKESNKDLGAVITVIASEFNLPVPITDRALSFSFNQDREQLDRRLKNQKRINIYEEDNETGFNYIYKLTPGNKDIIFDESIINVGEDNVIFSTIPLNVSINDDYSPTRKYIVGDIVTYDQRIYRCILEHTGKPPSFDSGYWYRFTDNNGLSIPSYYVLEYGPSTDPTRYSTFISWRMAALLGCYSEDIPLRDTRYARYKIEKLDGTKGSVQNNDRIRLTNLNTDISYSATDLENLFGDFPRGLDNTTGLDDTTTTWSDFLSFGFGHVPAPTIPKEFIGNCMIENMSDTANIIDIIPFYFLSQDRIEVTTPYKMIDYNVSLRFENKQIIQCFTAAYNAKLSSGIFADVILNAEYNKTEQSNTNKVTYIQDVRSRAFRLLPNTNILQTDLYLYINDEIINLPTNGELSLQIDDNERRIANADKLTLTLEQIQKSGNIHKVTPDNTLAIGQILSGDTISFGDNIYKREDYLTAKKFVIEKIIIENGDMTSTGGTIKIGDFVRLTSTDRSYPSKPDGWQLGDEWPTTGDWNNIPPPAIVTLDGKIRLWSSLKEDQLPIGPVEIYGTVGLERQIKPLGIDNDGLWYLIDGSLWTSKNSPSNIIELDEIINAERNGTTLLIQFKNDVPDYSTTLNETFLSFAPKKEGTNLLQVTSTRRDIDKRVTEDGETFLWYLPKINEQKFSKKITNLHTLSENEIGIFTEDEIWYIKSIINNNIIDYTRPIKSKLPVGCREGSDIITALDGKLIVFTTQRGITALSPQDFVASTEQTVRYLSDNIQNTYHSFYNDFVYSSISSQKPMIKIAAYKYWLLFYRYMDKKILAFDTRTNAWWKWTTPYPIKSLTVGTRLHFLLQLDISFDNDNNYVAPPKDTLLGVSFIWADREVDNDIGYYDDTVNEALDGLGDWVYENSTIGYRRVTHHANPMIKWHFTSQKLHFNEINNYKLIKAINMSAKGNSTQTARLSNKAYRDFYHPENSEVNEIEINDVRTFIQRLNLMHVINFQYKVETDDLNENQEQIKLNSLSIKYELKERIR